MYFAPNLLLNPSAEDGLDNWTCTNVEAVLGGIDGDYCFELTGNASMHQSLSSAFVVQNERYFRVQGYFRRLIPPNAYYSMSTALVKLLIVYSSGRLDEFAIDLVEGYTDTLSDGVNDWYLFEGICEIAKGIEIVTATISVWEDTDENIQIDRLYLQLSSDFTHTIDTRYRKVWHFDSHLRSSDGISPNAGVDATIHLYNGKFLGCAQVHALEYTTDLYLTDGWTISLYRATISMETWGPWVHYAINSNGIIYVDGVRDDDADVSFVDISIVGYVGVLTLDGVNFDGCGIDEVMLMEGCASEEEMLYWYSTPAPFVDPAQANLPEWIVEWDTGKTIIDDYYIVTPKLFTGAGGEDATGVAMGVDPVTGEAAAMLTGYNDGDMVWQFDKDHLEIIGGGDNSAGISAEGITDDDIRFWAGETYANRATAPFRVTQGGEITCTNFIAPATIDDVDVRVVINGTEGLAFYKSDGEGGWDKVGGYAFREEELIIDLPVDSVEQAQIHQTTGSVSGETNGVEVVNVNMNSAYCFFPNIYSINAGVYSVATSDANSSSYLGRFGMLSTGYGQFTIRWTRIYG